MTVCLAWSGPDRQRRDRAGVGHRGLDRHGDLQPLQLRQMTYSLRVVGDARPGTPTAPSARGQAVFTNEVLGDSSRPPPLRVCGLPAPSRPSARRRATSVIDDSGPTTGGGDHYVWTSRPSGHPAHAGCVLLGPHPSTTPHDAARRLSGRTRFASRHVRRSHTRSRAEPDGSSDVACAPCSRRRVPEDHLRRRPRDRAAERLAGPPARRSTRRSAPASMRRKVEEHEVRRRRLLLRGGRRERRRHLVRLVADSRTCSTRSRGCRPRPATRATRSPSARSRWTTCARAAGTRRRASRTWTSTTSRRRSSFPSFPRFCGQTFLERKDKELADLCVKAYNDWMFDEWCAGTDGRLIPLIIVQLWDAELAAAEVRRNAARGGHAVCFTRDPAVPRPAVDARRRRLLGPVLRGVRGDRDRRVACTSARRRRCRRRRPTRPPAVGSHAHVHERGDVAHRLADVGDLRALPGPHRSRTREGQIGWIPYVLERADKVWEDNRGWGGVADKVLAPAVGVLLRARLRLLLRRPARPASRSTRSASTTSPSRPTTRTPTHLAAHQEGRRGHHGGPRRRHVVQDRAGQRDPDAAPRPPGLTTSRPSSTGQIHRSRGIP